MFLTCVVHIRLVRFYIREYIDMKSVETDDTFASILLILNVDLESFIFNTRNV